MLRMRLTPIAGQVRVLVVIALLAAALLGFISVSATGVRFEDGHAEFLKERVEEALEQGKVLQQRDIQRIAESYPHRTQPYDVASWRYFSAAFRQASFIMAVLVLLVGVIARVKGAESVWFSVGFLILGLCFAAPLAVYALVFSAAAIAWLIEKVREKRFPEKKAPGS